MIPILYEKNEDGFLTNGIGRLTDTISCRVTEERNGKYELEMVYPATGLHFDMIQNERILYVRHSDGLDLQPFRIYRISKPMNGKVMIYARHKSYDLLKMTVMPCTAETCAEALEEISSNTISGSKFSYWTDKTTVANFKIEVPTLVRSALGGTEGSVLDTFGGGEYEFDHDTVKLHANRGVDSGVTIRYGKNLRDFTQELNADGVITGVAPFWQAASEDKTVVTLPEGAVIAASSASGQLTEYYWDENEQIYRDEQGKPYETNADTLGIVPLDLSADFKDAPTVEQLRAAAVAYLRANAAKLEETESIKISFVHLWQTEEYENVAPLQRLRLCDTATVYYPQYEVEVTAKVVKTVYNVLLERYDSMELGDARRSYAKTITGQNLKIQSVKKEVEDRSASMMAEAINHATQMITGGLGGHVVMKQNADGEPEEILIMDTDDISTAVNVIRMNKNGIAFSRNGYNGTYRTAWTIDGSFVADFITTGTLTANLIKAGTMSADRILGGTMKLGGASNKNGVLEIYNSSNQRVGRWDAEALFLGNIAGNLDNPNTKIGKDGKINTKGITINGGSINIDNKFVVTSAGAVTAKSLTANDYIYLDGKSDASMIKIPLGTSGHNIIDSYGQVFRSKSRYAYSSCVGNYGAYYNGTDTIGLIVGKLTANNKINTSQRYLRVDLRGIYIHGHTYGMDTVRLSPQILTFHDSNDTETMRLATFGSLLKSLKVDGNLTVTGTKPRLVKTKDYGERYLYCYETPSPLFGDVGEGKIGSDGKCFVQIDSIFAETVTLKQYQVFLQKYGDGDCWIEERNSSFFVVEGTPGLSFGWEIKAKQSDFDQFRLEKEVGNQTDEKIDYADELDKHINNLKTMREVAA